MHACKRPSIPLFVACVLSCFTPSGAWFYFFRVPPPSLDSSVLGHFFLLYSLLHASIFFVLFLPPSFVLTLLSACCLVPYTYSRANETQRLIWWTISGVIVIIAVGRCGRRVIVTFADTRSLGGHPDDRLSPCPPFYHSITPTHVYDTHTTRPVHDPKHISVIPSTPRRGGRKTSWLLGPEDCLSSPRDVCA